MMLEMADTINRHLWLFKRDEEFEMKRLNIMYNEKDFKDNTKLYRKNLKISKGTMLAYINGGENYNALGELHQQRLRNIELQYGNKSPSFKNMWSKAYPNDMTMDVTKLTPLVKYLFLLTKGS